MKTKIILATCLLALVNIASAEWYTVTTVGLPQTLTAGQTYKNVSLTLTNTTQSAVTVTSSVSAVPKNFPTNSTNACASATLAPGASCILASAKNYSPSSDGTATWTANINDGFEPFTKNVSYSIVSGVDASISSLPKNTAVGETDPVQINVINNSGAAAKGFSVNLPSIAGLTYTQNSCASISILTAGQRCTIIGSYSPVEGTTGDVSVDATVDYNSGQTIKLQTDTNVVAVPVKGLVAPPKSNVSVEGTDKFSYTFTNTNTTDPATNVSVSLPSDPGLTTVSNNCGSTIAASSSCTINMAYVPPDGAEGTHDFSAVLSYAEGNDVELIHQAAVSSIPVSGFVTPPAANVAIEQKDNFSYTFVNKSKTAAATGVAIKLPEEPGLVIDSNSCSSTIAANKSCVIRATYTPPVDSQGTHQFEAVLSYADGGDVVLTHTAHISAVPINATVSPKRVNVPVAGTDNFTYSFVNKNATAATGIRITLPVEAGLSVTNNCGTTLAANSTCTVSATYTPPVGSQGKHDFTLIFKYAEGGDLVLTHEATVTAVPLRLTVSPENANVKVGQADAFHYTLTNSSDSTATNISVLDPVEAGLVITDNCGTTLAAKKSCSIQGAYTPPADSEGKHDFTAVVSYAEGGDLVATHEANVSALPITANVSPATASVPVETADSFTYTFINSNDVAATGVKLTLPVEAGLTVANNCEGRIAAESSCAVNATYTPPVGSKGKHDFRVILSYAEGADVIATHEATVSAVKVAASIDHPSANVEVGQDDTFTYTYTNESGITVSSIDIITPTEVGLTVTNNCGTTLAAGASCTVVGSYIPPVGSQGEHDFTAVFTYTQGGDLILTHKAFVTTLPVVGVQTPRQIGTAAVGGTDVFTYTYTNNGTSPATNVRLMVPAGDDIQKTTTCGTTLAAGASCQVNVTFTVPAGSAVGTEYFFPGVFKYDEGGDVLLIHQTNVVAASK